MRNKDFDKQNRIKEAMIQLILREGIDGTSMSKIAKEAGVSPATIYVYYESKEDMLSEVFQEYAKKSYDYLMERIRPTMDAKELIEAIIKSYYSFSVEYKEIFSFVEQCSRCPTLSHSFSEKECSCNILDFIHKYQMRGSIQSFSDLNISAVLFAPVRFLALNRQWFEKDEDVLLDELVCMLQRILLK